LAPQEAVDTILNLFGDAAIRVPTTAFCMAIDSATTFPNGSGNAEGIKETSNAA